MGWTNEGWDIALNPPSLKSNWQIINLALDYGLSTTGTDAIARMQNAVNDAPAGGWKLYIPPGVYPDNGGVPLSIQKSNIALVGASRRLSKIKPPNGVNYSIIQVGDATHNFANFLFQDFSIDNGIAPPSYANLGYGLYLWNASFVNVHRVDALRTGDHGMHIGLGNTIHLLNCIVGQNQGAGFKLSSGCGNVWLDACMSDSVFGSPGIYLTGGQPAWIRGCSVFGGQNEGIQDAFNHGQGGLVIEGCAIFGNAAGQAQNAFSAIHLTGASSGVIIKGNRCTNDSVNTSSAGIILDAGASNATIEGNDCRMVTVGPTPLIDNSGNSTNVIRNNAGVNPIGVVTPGVPGTGVAVAAANYDRTFYVTTAALGCTMTIQNGPAVVIPATSFGTVRVPAGKTVTPAFTNPPTWVVEGE